ncbi:hypothetical protein [Aureimonas phyllosphaerae]|uniref:Uncharacterized protein n=1 Tax=Aureimonas phyllosphaerae TaxID=1166078 RepID=A0A7W6FVV7_9HYPH|nr:hypothetical protein [Aureimonas phyllosphaerae]MBB3937531.1 hypothetical protein [Aureimonas phyllosphaerae]MBB3961403.1 hypothetical protein [Aureimonas phyllosphaerae]SFF37770.1 hypothetical protein SAMN05216566_1109 [Aureimonas phyllosphaerae]
MTEIEHEDEVWFAIEALQQADRDMVAFELDEGDGEDTFLGEGSTYERIKARVDAAIAAIEDEGLNRETAAKGTLALLESILLTTYAEHMGMIEAAVRMTNAAEARANG